MQGLTSLRNPENSTGSEGAFLPASCIISLNALWGPCPISEYRHWQLKLRALA